MPAAALVNRHVRALRTALPKALIGDIEGVHKVRVASRRLRELIPIVAGPTGRGKKLSRFARSLTRAFGPVREIDVAAGLLRTIEARRQLRGTVTVARALEAERRRRRRALQKQVDGPDALRRLSRLDAAAVANLDEVRKQAPALVAARMLARAARLEETIEAAGSLYDVERLHQVRIAVKKLRYSLELVPELHLGREAPDLKRLKAAQDLLGSLHDLEVLAQFAREVDAKNPRRGVHHLIGVIDEELRHHHAHFLRSRAILSGVIARVRQRGGELAGLALSGAPSILD